MPGRDSTLPQRQEVQLCSQVHKGPTRLPKLGTTPILKATTLTTPVFADKLERLRGSGALGS